MTSTVGIQAVKISKIEKNLGVLDLMTPVLRVPRGNRTLMTFFNGTILINYVNPKKKSALMT